MDLRPAVARPPRDPDARVVNRWYSRRLGRVVRVREARGRLYADSEPRGHEARFRSWVDHLLGSDSWSVRAERRARERLRSPSGPLASGRYEVMGSFAEHNPRSGVTYLFRMGRPTLATRYSRARQGFRFLASLCLHPLGFYAGTRAGAMAPTDDLIAHLMLIRGCEPMHWAKSIEHAIWAPESGI